MQSDFKSQKEILGDRFGSLEVMNKSTPFEASEEGTEMGSNEIEGSYCLGHEDIADQDLLSSMYNEEDQLKLPAHMGILDGLYHDIFVSSPFQGFGEEIMLLSSDKSQNSQHIKSDEGTFFSFPKASLEILKSYRSRLAAAHGRKIDGQLCDSNQWPIPSSPLSTNHIIELAAGNFIQSNSATMTELSAISHPYACSFLGLPADNVKDVQLVQALLMCAEKVGNQQYIFASKLLEECNKLSSDRTSSVQRLVYYFTEALCEKINRENGRITGKEKFSFESIIPKSAMVALQKNIPITQISQFSCIETMIDHVSGSRKVHIIDLEILSAVRLIVLMEALASRTECPLEHFKVTTVATTSKFHEVHLHLKSMAESLKLSFSFHTVMLENILKNQKDLFDLDAEEVVVIHASYFLQTMIPEPHQLERLIRAMECTKPRVMVVTESELNANSPIFVNRFVEAMFFYGAYFDCLKDCLTNVADRTGVESSVLSPAIRNIVAAEGEDRNIRVVGINVWKKFLTRLGMVEMELSKSTISHANLTRERFACGDSCTLGLNGNSLIIGWKGTPICSLSSWRFRGRQSMKKT